MAVKIDLEKAYDRVRWDFIEASLKTARIPPYLQKVIMTAISSSTMQILWNGVPIKKFKPAKGVRQGYPLSPYLFVLCMEWLGHNIKKVILYKEWKLIKLSRARPSLTYLFFADYLVIFSKADLSHGQTLKSILEQFCNYFGYRVNCRKTNLFFLRGVDDALRIEISGLLGYQQVHDFNSYLGVPLLHK